MLLALPCIHELHARLVADRDASVTTLAVAGEAPFRAALLAAERAVVKKLGS